MRYAIKKPRSKSNGKKWGNKSSETKTRAFWVGYGAASDKGFLKELENDKTVGRAVSSGAAAAVENKKRTKLGVYPPQKKHFQ